MQRTTLAVLVGALVVVSSLGSAGLVMGLTDDTAPTQQQPPQANNTDTSTITVSASGDAETQPDAAVLRLAVQARSPDASTARTQVAENVSEVRAALLDLGIDEEDIRTVDYDIYRDDRSRPVNGEPPSEPVYRARHVIAVDLDDVEMAGDAIDAAVDAGATDVQDVQFTLAEDTRLDLRNQALTEAMSNARSEGDTIASSADLEITGVQTVTTQQDFGPVPRYEVAMAADGGDAATSIDSGPVSVTATVTVTYNASG